MLVPICGSGIRIPIVVLLDILPLITSHLAATDGSGIPGKNLSAYILIQT
jgi:hypothetical protein